MAIEELDEKEVLALLELAATDEGHSREERVDGLEKALENLARLTRDNEDASKTLSPFAMSALRSLLTTSGEDYEKWLSNVATAARSVSMRPLLVAAEEILAPILDGLKSESVKVLEQVIRVVANLVADNDEGRRILMGKEVHFGLMNLCEHKETVISRLSLVALFNMLIDNQDVQRSLFQHKLVPLFNRLCTNAVLPVLRTVFNIIHYLEDDVIALKEFSEGRIWATVFSIVSSSECAKDRREYLAEETFTWAKNDDLVKYIIEAVSVQTLVDLSQSESISATNSKECGAVDAVGAKCCLRVLEGIVKTSEHSEAFLKDNPSNIQTIADIIKAHSKHTFKDPKSEKELACAILTSSSLILSSLVDNDKLYVPLMDQFASTFISFLQSEHTSLRRAGIMAVGNVKTDESCDYVVKHDYLDHILSCITEFDADDDEAEHVVVMAASSLRNLSISKKTIPHLLKKKAHEKIPFLLGHESPVLRLYGLVAGRHMILFENSPKQDFADMNIGALAALGSYSPVPHIQGESLRLLIAMFELPEIGKAIVDQVRKIEKYDEHLTELVEKSDNAHIQGFAKQVKEFVLAK